jgi:putative transposase
MRKLAAKASDANRANRDIHEYEWSSYHCNAFGGFDRLVQPHHEYLSLGAISRDRCEAYKLLIDESLDSDQLEAIRAHLQRQRALGSDRFRFATETLLNRRAGRAKTGRPRMPTIDLQSAT